MGLDAGRNWSRLLARSGRTILDMAVLDDGPSAASSVLVLPIPSRTNPRLGQGFADGTNAQRAGPWECPSERRLHPFSAQWGTAGEDALVILVRRGSTGLAWPGHPAKAFWNHPVLPNLDRTACRDGSRFKRSIG